MKHITIFTFLGMALASCSEPTIEEQAARMVYEARYALGHHHYDEARDTILSMRRRFPTAIEARKQGILLLDSIEMHAAQDSLQYADGEEWERLNIKQQFFERKLEEDKKK